MKKFFLTILLFILVTADAFSNESLSCPFFSPKQTLAAGFVNYQKIEHDNFYKWIIEKVLFSHDKNDVAIREGELLNFKNNVFLNSIKYIYFQLDNSEFMSPDFLSMLIVFDEKYEKAQFVNLLKKLLKKNEYTLSSDDRINDALISGKIYIAEGEINFYLLKTGSELYIGNPEKISCLEKIKNSYQSIDDVQVVYFSNESIRNNITDWNNKYHKMYPKNTFPVDIHLLGDINCAALTIDIDQETQFNLKLYFDGEQQLVSGRKFFDRVLPLIRFELLTLTKGSKLDIVNSMKLSIDNQNKSLVFSFNFSKNDFNKLVTKGDVKDGN